LCDVIQDTDSNSRETIVRTLLIEVKLGKEL